MISNKNQPTKWSHVNHRSGQAIIEVFNTLMVAIV